MAIAVDPQAQAVLDKIASMMAAAPKPDRPPSEAERVAMARHGYAATVGMAGLPEPVAEIHDMAVPGPSGPIPLRIYQPTIAGGRQPVLLWFHGGSFIAGDLETHDPPLRALANRAGLPVIAVAWRLAPEHPYPAGVEDADAVLRWAAGGGSDALRVDPERIAIGGDSAGGAIAAVLAQIARDRGGPAIALQVLIYPNTDLADDGRDYASWAENDGRVLRRADMERNFALYAAGADLALPGLSPLRAETLAGLPPALIVTGEADPQRDEGGAYAGRLRTAGVSVEHVLYPGMIHGFFQMAGVIDAARELIGQVGAAARSALLPSDER